jgi:4'-phosphopantetheinyl transferase
MVTLVSSRCWDALVEEAHAWQVCPEELAPRAVRERSLWWLSQDERAKYEQLHDRRLQHAYLTAQVLCRTTLSRYAGVHPSEWTFRTGSHGKPSVGGPGGFESLRFNLTHTDGLAICLVTRAGDVGVDAEETSSKVDWALVARHFFSPAEQSWLANLQMHERYSWAFGQWVLKEAYLKGIGSGLDTPERVTVERGDDRRPVAIGNWQLSLHDPSPCHVAAAAVHRRRGVSRILMRWLKSENLLEVSSPPQTGTT